MAQKLGRSTYTGQNDTERWDKEKEGDTFPDQTIY